MRRSAVAIVAAFLLALPLRAQAPTALSDSAFARLISQLSEPAGYFDTDNLISNEDSYLHVVGTVKRLGVTGGAYLGVGPDQNYSYIAAVRPHIAFIVDIRRDNLLEHLLFKSIFALSRNRVEYLCLLFGKRPPADTAGWGARGPLEILAYIDSTPNASAAAGNIRARVIERVRQMAIPLSQADIATIGRFHLEFISQGPSLRFNTLGRAPQAYYPDYRRLMLETDRTGRQSSYLAHEDDFQLVKRLQDRNLVVPVVGDFAGDKALSAIGEWLRARSETVSAFYTSNVEQYLMRDDSFDRFAASLARLPRTAKSIMLRSFFLGNHPQQVPGYHATQLAQLMDRFVAVEAVGGFRDYYMLATRDVIDR